MELVKNPKIQVMINEIINDPPEDHTTPPQKKASADAFGGTPLVIGEVLREKTSTFQEKFNQLYHQR